MRVNSIQNSGIKYNFKKNIPFQEPPVPNQPQFRGKAGSVVGALAGGAAAVGLAFVAAPVLVCAGPLLGALGAMAADKAEDKIRQKNKSDKI